MKQLFDVRFNVFIIGLTISSILERTVTALINSHNLLGLTPNSLEYHTLSLITLVVFFLVTNVLLRSITNRPFVSKMAFGKRYIGGTWVEFVIKKNHEISHITRMKIDCDIYEVKIHGECHRSDSSKYTFDSICSTLDDYKLHYIFVADEAFKPSRIDRGYLNFLATSDKKTFDKYIGHYMDGEDEYEIAAILIKDKSIIEDLDKNIIETACKEVFPDLRRIHGRPDLVLPASFSASV